MKIWIGHKVLPSLFIAFVALANNVLTALPALACSLAETPPFPERLLQQERLAELIVVADVVDEQPLKSAGTQSVYRSTIRPLAVLKGQPQSDVIELAPQGYLAPDCAGGPRLQTGTRVLLFLRTQADQHTMGTQAQFPMSKWQVVLIGPGKYLLQNGQAYGTTTFFEEAAEPVGVAEDLIRKIGTHVGTPEAVVNEALRAASGNGAPQVRTGGSDEIPLGKNTSSVRHEGSDQVSPVMVGALVMALAGLVGSCALAVYRSRVWFIDK